MVTPDQILALALEQATENGLDSIIKQLELTAEAEYVCRNIQNKAGSRLLLACLLAKVHRPEVDIRKPYTEIGDIDSYSGRTYDEMYIGKFVIKNDLPCNPTTAFLTPAFRNRNITLSTDINLVGRPPQLYQAVLNLLNAVFTNQTAAEDLLAEIIRILLVIRSEIRQRTETLLAALRSTQDGIPLSSEAIIKLIEQHLDQPRSSRLPVLVVAAAYQAAALHLGEKFLPLMSHNAADQQTASLGDLEITLLNDDEVITTYEMKTRNVTLNDIDRALQKIRDANKRIDNYIFITTEPIEDDVQRYALSIYELTNGIEFIILDCIRFLRHFLHLFHRLRIQFLDKYQELILIESESAVSQPLKEVFLTLRQAAESDN